MTKLTDYVKLYVESHPRAKIEIGRDIQTLGLVLIEDYTPEEVSETIYDLPPLTKAWMRDILDLVRKEE